MSKFRLEGDLRKNLDGMDRRANMAMVAAANYVAPQLEAHMKATAKWTDRTGNARSGLTALINVEPNRVAIVLYHKVPYGVFLEVRWGGKYAVIQPTLAYGAPMFAKAIGKLLFKR